ncbi:MAG TPA: sulfite exporter TauE/SafE family protein [Streptosporangiaceae bacterium]
MQVDPYIVLGSAIVGLLVGLTGAGGGALMTPMLILIFGIKPSTAISSDLVAAVLMRPVGAIVHLRKGTVNLRLVGWLVLGSVPMALVGAYLLKLLGSGSTAQTRIEQILGAALLVGAAAMVLRYVLDWRSGQQRLASVREIVPRPALTVVVGMIGGVIVGMTSVGSGSLMIVLLLFLYPAIGAGQLVGTDLTQAVPLTLAAALGALLFGHVQFAVTASIVIGSVPAVLIGSFLSSRAPDRYIRPVITFVIFASGLKYAGVGTMALGWILCAVLLAAAVGWLAVARPWRPAQARSPVARVTPVALLTPVPEAAQGPGGQPPPAPPPGQGPGVQPPPAPPPDGYSPSGPGSPGEGKPVPATHAPEDTPATSAPPAPDVLP